MPSAAVCYDDGVVTSFLISTFWIQKNLNLICDYVGVCISVNQYKSDSLTPLMWWFEKSAELIFVLKTNSPLCNQNNLLARHKLRIQ